MLVIFIKYQKSVIKFSKNLILYSKESGSNATMDEGIETVLLKFSLAQRVI